MRFVLEIKIGNAAMSDLQDVALAVDNVAKSLHQSAFYDGAQLDDVGGAKVFDDNGNSVGAWRFEGA